MNLSICFLALALASCSLAFKTAAIVFNAIFAFSLGGSLTVAQLLAFLAFAANLLALGGMAILISRYIPKLKARSRAWPSAFFWRFLAMAMATAGVAAVLSITTLLWAAIKVADLPMTIAGQSSRTVVVIWFVLWATSAFLETCTFAVSAWWTKRALRLRQLAAIDLGLTQRASPKQNPQFRPPRTASSYRSQDLTLAPSSPPPTSVYLDKPQPLRLAGVERTTDVAASPTRIAHPVLSIPNSAKSSSEYSSAERGSTDHPFDTWDTSAVHGEIRNTLHSERRGNNIELDTIPGSKPDSPAKTLDEPFLPQSPRAQALHQKRTTSNSQLVGSLRPNATSTSTTPPHSPPFRPPSGQISLSHTSPSRGVATTDDAAENLVHPLFRASSPQPAPIAMAGTIVVACPLAGKSITPGALTRIRSASAVQQQPQLAQLDMTQSPEHLRPQLETPNDSHSPTSSGSPGPSIMDDAEADAAIPQFVLTAGQRRSLLGYGRYRSFFGRSTSSGPS